MMRKQWTLTMLLLCCSVWIASFAPAFAQTITGSVRGLVTDPSGAVVPGAKVLVKNVDTGIVTQTTTDRVGLYSASFLILGNYTVTTTVPGFGNISEGPFALQIDQIAKVDLHLRIGSAESTVN